MEEAESRVVYGLSAFAPNGFGMVYQNDPMYGVEGLLSAGRNAQQSVCTATIVFIQIVLCKITACTASNGVLSAGRDSQKSVCTATIVLM